MKWAQRSDKVYITVELPDAEDVKLKLEPQGKFLFTATSGASKTPYEVDLDLFDNVDVNVSAKIDLVFFFCMCSCNQFWIVEIVILG